MMFKWLGKIIGQWIVESVNDEEECDCGDEGGCNCIDEKMRMEQQEMIDNWKPPARYCIRAGGIEYFVDSWKPAMGGYGIDIFWTQKIGGVDRGVSGTIIENSFTIIDYESVATYEMFEHAKKQSFEYVMQAAQEAKLQEDAKKKNATPPSDVSLASYG
jgi:hypothetical protein